MIWEIRIRMLPPLIERADEGVVRIDILDDEIEKEPLRKWRSREEREYDK